MVFAHCGIVPDFDIRPFSSTVKLKRFCDILAHGKPEVLSYEYEEVREFGNASQPGYLETDWEQMRTTETVRECYEDINSIWLAMLAAIDMSEIEASSHGSRGMTYLGEAG